MTRPSFSISIPGTCTEEGFVPGNGNVSNTATVLKSRFASETVVGTSRRKPEGWLPPTNYSFSRERLEKWNGTSRNRATTISTGKVIRDLRYSGRLDGFSQTSSLNDCNSAYIATAVPQGLVDLAVLRARLQMKGQSVNLGVAFAERNQTATLVGDTARSLASCFRNMRRGNFRQALRDVSVDASHYSGKLNKVSSKFLAFQFGVKPLLSDVYGATEALARSPDRNWRITGKGSARDEIDRTWDSRLISANNHLRVRCKGNYGVYVRIDALPQYGLLQSWTSLGLTNPAVIAWEVVPWSFVLDWILPVGPWLDSLDAMLGYGPTSCSISKFAKFRWDGRGFNETYTDSTVRTDREITASMHRETLSVNRGVSSSVPLPGIPRFKDPRSLAHMANGLALLAQAITGR